MEPISPSPFLSLFARDAPAEQATRAITFIIEMLNKNARCAAIAKGSAVPAISLLIPIYNVEKYLRECLDSVLAQSFTDFEAICINDGSTDSSRAIVQEYLDADGRFRVIDKANSGYGASMNQGLDAATGKYVAILESDDAFTPDALEVLYNLATTHNAQAVKADFWFYWSQNEKLEPCHVISEGLCGKLVNPQEVFEPFYAKPSIWSGIYNRTFLQENDIRFLETPGASYQDAGFAFKVWAAAERAAFSSTQILKYRQDNEASSVNSPGKVYCVCDEYAEMQRWLDARPAKKQHLQGVLERMKFNSYLWNYDRLSAELRAEFLKHAAQELKTDLDAGRVDLALFEPWAEADLRALIKKPETFAKCRTEYAAPGKLNTFKHYYRIGSMPLIAKLLKNKVAK
jgi:hypothetical protein